MDTFLFLATLYLTLRLLAADVAPSSAHAQSVSPTATVSVTATPTPTPTPTPALAYFVIDVASPEFYGDAPSPADIVLHFVLHFKSSDVRTEPFTHFFISTAHGGISHSNPDEGILEIIPKADFKGEIVVAVVLRTLQKVVVVHIQCY
jgi:hypothetical protein